MGSLSRWTIVDQVTAVLAFLSRASQHRRASLNGNRTTLSSRYELYNMIEMDARQLVLVSRHV
jgi:hypothetical protein